MRYTDRKVLLSLGQSQTPGNSIRLGCGDSGDDRRLRPRTLFPRRPRADVARPNCRVGGCRTRMSQPDLDILVGLGQTIDAPSRGPAGRLASMAGHRASIAREGAMGPSRTRNDASQKWRLTSPFARLPRSGDTPDSLMTRRSRVQIPPPLLKAPVSSPLTGASTVSRHRSTAASTGFSTGGPRSAVRRSGRHRPACRGGRVVGVDGERRVAVPATDNQSSRGPGQAAPEVRLSDARPGRRAGPDRKQLHS